MTIECTKDQLTQWIQDEKSSSYLVGLYDCKCLLEEFNFTQGNSIETKNPKYKSYRKENLAEKFDEYLKTTLINKNGLYEKTFSELKIIIIKFDPLGFIMAEGAEHSYDQLVDEVMIRLNNTIQTLGIQIILLEVIYKIYRNFSFTLDKVEDLAKSIEMWLKNQDAWS